MGDPKKHRKKYDTPTHPWQAERMAVESQLLKDYGLKNKTEIWIANSMVRNFASQAKSLIRLIKTGNSQAEKEKKQLLSRLNSLGLLPITTTLDDVLDINIRDMLERRLQTILFNKKLAKTIKQARQFITHGHVIVNNKLVTAPSYLVSVKEEKVITFIATSQLSQPDHPERVNEKPSPEKVQEMVKEKEGAKSKNE